MICVGNGNESIRMTWRAWQALVEYEEFGIDRRSDTQFAGQVFCSSQPN
jgi:hypothetical protein